MEVVRNATGCWGFQSSNVGVLGNSLQDDYEDQGLC